ncbi:MAG: VCBS repeat-containing protein [Balneolaceae bacterium]|nr:VCBS repeat-containing protein [Balneolaceae bacterium]
MKNRHSFASLSVQLLLLSIITGIACSSSSQLPNSNSGEGEFTRTIDWISVLDETGSSLDHPFLGGLNTPRPQFVDIDADGDPDLFVQEHTNELMFFENTNPGSENPLTFRSEQYFEIDIGEWFRFVDMDQDGDFDLLTEQPFSYISYYKNTGNAETPNFVLMADSLKDASGTPIFSDRQNIPNVTDIDCDGLPDLFIGSLEGTVSRYESTGFDENDIPKFELLTKRFEDIEIVKQFGTMHGANTMTFMDIDSDGDEDIFWGDFFEPSILLLENEGTCKNPIFRGEPQPFPPGNPVESSGYNAPALVDWNMDGDADLLLGVLGGAYNANRTTAENFFYYEQTPTGFKLETKQFLEQIDVGDESIPAAGDIDGDGDIDLLLANKIDPSNLKSSVVYIFENIGSATQPEFQKVGNIDLPNGYHYAPELTDLNNDGFADLLLGSWKGDIAYYINQSGSFELKSEAFVELPRGSNAVPRAIDIDNDGDLDLVSGSSGGDIHLFRNVGSKTEPTFEYVEVAFDGIESKHRSTPTFCDADNDGDFDLLTGSKIEGLLYFENKGTPESPTFERAELPITTATAPLSAPLFKDINGDGTPELLIGTRSGGLLLYRKN